MDYFIPSVAAIIDPQLARKVLHGGDEQMSFRLLLGHRCDMAVSTFGYLQMEAGRGKNIELMSEGRVHEAFATHLAAELEANGIDSKQIDIQQACKEMIAFYSDQAQQTGSRQADLWRLDKDYGSLLVSGHTLYLKLGSARQCKTIPYKTRYRGGKMQHDEGASPQAPSQTRQELFEQISQSKYHCPFCVALQQEVIANGIEAIETWDGMICGGVEDMQNRLARADGKPVFDYKAYIDRLFE